MEETLSFSVLIEVLRNENNPVTFQTKMEIVQSSSYH